ncbi:tRNA glutamyl-Q(34) synthetase GluQRS [Simiduia curdlanivorans]|uniref:Glutamyl-Q tRNA(Asp) synthetase n=1 Tax=Simiduia curdlanivorans TaxID=1492769 RepID=A0ABV8V6A2_9GAMM|nr:tRNA glutamyl-Q(34) synthetase GluQRS [Simiduia curdlanivorans]MDN3640859.1 tRNA glutamyl-Q(34) synthetase GluQRS [Simiduia curdlanivorans]
MSSLAKLRQYRGRFAPSPTGPLHFGSLLAALASYLDARAHQGTWLIRMEDLDPPREQAGASQAILEALATHGLRADEPVLFQSQRLTAYESILQKLDSKGLIYLCSCNRNRLAALGRVYDRHCLHTPPAAGETVAWRIKLPQPEQAVSFEDAIQGQQSQTPASDFGDFILKRKDGLHAYQLAVVADDIYQGISHVVRGSDLLEVSARQQLLFQLLGEPAPAWAHIPVINNSHGQKLSKQNHAPALDLSTPQYNLIHALRLLGQAPPTSLLHGSVEALLHWGRANWSLAKVPKTLAQTDPLFSR